MSHAKIEEALRAAFLLALPAAVGNTAFENQLFNPEGREKWFIFNCLPNVPEVATLGSAGQDSLTGIAQVDINIATGKGKQGVEADIEALRNTFRAGVRLIRPPLSIRIKSCGRVGIGRKVDAFYRYTISIVWECHVSRHEGFDDIYLGESSFRIDEMGNLIYSYPDGARPLNFNIGETGNLTFTV